MGKRGKARNSAAKRRGQKVRRLARALVGKVPAGKVFEEGKRRRPKHKKAPDEE